MTSWTEMCKRYALAALQLGIAIGELTAAEHDLRVAIDLGADPDGVAELVDIGQNLRAAREALEHSAALARELLAQADAQALAEAANQSEEEEQT